MKALQGHPNIVCLEGIENFDNKVALIAMEYCNKDLKTFLADPTQRDKQKRLSEGEAQVCMRQLANAFKFMCGLAIAHRDLKPQNILVSTFADGSFVLKISDFGFARKMEKETTMAASLLGTPLYMAPEIYQRKYSDTCDLWSLGAILYELLFGFYGLSKNIEEFRKGNAAKVMSAEKLSEECKSLMVALLQPDPTKRISMLDFFSHPFIIEPHPEVSLLSPQQLSDLQEENTIRVFVFPTLETFTLPFDDKLSVFEWKQKSGLQESDSLVLCRDTATNETSAQERWSGVELKDIEILESYQIGELGTVNKCLFVFRKNATINPSNLLAELPNAPEMVAADLPIDEFFTKCKAFVVELYEGISRAYDICSKFVLVRELMLFALRALCTVIKSKKGDLEADIQKTSHLVEPQREKWHTLRAKFTQTRALIEQLPTIGLPEFIRPKPDLVNDLIAKKQKELDAEAALLKSIDASFVSAKQVLSFSLPSNFSLDEKLKTLLNRDIYECRKNGEHFKNNFEKASTLPSDKCEGEEKEAWLTLLNFSRVLTQKVRSFYSLCKDDVVHTMEIAHQIDKVLAQHAQLAKMTDPDAAEVFSIPNLEKAINAFSNALDMVSEFNALPELVGRVVRLLQERQSYEKMISDVVPRTDAMLQQLFTRHNNLAVVYEKNKQQIDQIFPKFPQLSALPRPRASIDPPPALKDYPKISANFLLPASPAPDLDLETDQFSFIISEHMNISDLLRDNGVLAEKLRSTTCELDDARARLKDAEARAGVGAGDLARKVALYERMAKIKSDTENNKTKDFEDEKRLLLEQSKTTEEKLNTERRLWEEERKKLQDEKTEKEAYMEAMKHASDVEANAQRQEMEKLRAQVSFYRTQEREMENLRQKEREKNLELERLRAQHQDLDALRARAREDEAQKQELERLRAQLDQESTARRNAEEVAEALTTQVGLLRDTIMAYEVSYGLDTMQQQPAPQT
eukprot:Phypoly_transcript_00892.p1 GENE.Phypoly_transcript_00892~~Phypoly_transcript_00892.p1  ORF type:complete len:1028 (-),score=244.72 Phypoly_transcript_00892:843-3764(-)